jgi:hypothetical protein
MTTIINGSSPSITFSDSTTQDSAGLTSSSGLNATNLTSGTVPFARLPTGSVLQVVYGSSNTVVTSTTTTRNGAATGLTATITPKYSTSKILVLWQVANSVDPTNNIYINLLRNGSTELLIGSGGGTNVTAKGYGIAYVDNLAAPSTGSYLDSPATTSATTYAPYFWVQGSTGYINRSSSNPVNTAVTSSITLLEIAG